MFPKEMGSQEFEFPSLHGIIADNADCFSFIPIWKHNKLSMPTYARTPQQFQTEKKNSEAYEEWNGYMAF